MRLQQAAQGRAGNIVRQIGDDDKTSRADQLQHVHLKKIIKYQVHVVVWGQLLFQDWLEAWMETVEYVDGWDEKVPFD